LRALHISLHLTFFFSCREGAYLGIDCSTQSLKAVCLDEEGAVVAEALVNFDRDLPEYKTSGIKQPSIS
jgi:sugar (pentulose or hexulose) kinase